MKNRIEMVVFDMDGVILDSEPLHYNAKIRIFKELGLPQTIDLSATVGRPNKELWESVIKKYDLIQTPDELEKLQYDYILEQLEDMGIKESSGLEELLQLLDDNGIIAAIASSSDRYYIDKVLRYLHLENRFKYTVAGDEVESKKPEPDVYLKVLELSGISPSDALAIEDSHSGCLAAVSAGIKCIGYRNCTSGNQDISKSAHQIDSLMEAGDIILELIYAE